MTTLSIATTSKELANALSVAFHGLTGFSAISQSQSKLFVVTGEETNNVPIERLKRIAKSIIREEDIAVIV